MTALVVQVTIAAVSVAACMARFACLSKTARVGVMAPLSAISMPAVVAVRAPMRVMTGVVAVALRTMPMRLVMAMVLRTMRQMAKINAQMQRAMPNAEQGMHARVGHAHRADAKAENQQCACEDTVSFHGSAPCV